MTFLRNIWNDEQGQDLIEYARERISRELVASGAPAGVSGKVSHHMADASLPACSSANACPIVGSPEETRPVSRPGQARHHQRTRLRRLRRLRHQIELRVGATARNRIRP